MKPPTAVWLNLSDWFTPVLCVAADWTDFWGTIVNYQDGAAPSSNRRLHRHLLQVTAVCTKWHSQQPRQNYLAEQT